MMDGPHGVPGLPPASESIGGSFRGPSPSPATAESTLHDVGSTPHPVRSSAPGFCARLSRSALLISHDVDLLVRPRCRSS